MAWTTLAGTTAAAADAYGLKTLASGAAPSANDFNYNWRDAIRGGAWALQPGVISGGVCTAANLVVTIPQNTIYYARSQWTNADAAATSTVPDDATTYLWGCSDGEIRQTANTTPPLGYDVSTACILCKATAAGGTATVDLTVQQKARLADNARILTANNQTDSYTLVIGDAGKVIEVNKGSAATVTIPANASVAFPIGTVIRVYQMGAGQVTVAITSDTLRAPNGAKTKGQYSVVEIWKRAATEWVLSGDSAA